MGNVEIHKISYHGWPNSYRLTNGDVELIATSDVGPRVMRYGFVNRQNMFYESPAQLGNSGEPWWMIRGGHRLWIAPETVPETYALDNRPVEVSFPADDTIRLRGGVEEETKLQKTMTMTLSENGGVRIAHEVANCGPHTVRWAPWPATLLAPGGTAFVAFPQRGSHEKHLLPTHPLVMWAYTDLSDSRWRFTKEHLILKQDANAVTEQKAGLFNENTFAGYLLGTDLFTKRCQASLGVPYADFHCSFQIFTNRDFMELETLGPLTDLDPDASVSHTEEWSLHQQIEVSGWTDGELNRLRSLIS